MLLRIFIGESDRWNHKPLYEAIVLKAREMHLGGATVLRGPMGFGKSSRMHTAKILRLSMDLPIVIEIVDSEEKMRRFFGAPERYPLPFRFQGWLAEHGELLYTTHPSSRGLSDWMDDPAHVRAQEPRCGVLGGELRVYRIKASNTH